MMKFKYKITLPLINKLRSCSKNIDPYTKLYKYVLKQIYPNWELFYNNDELGFPIIPNKQLNVSAVWLTKKDEEKLYKLVEDWFKYTYNYDAKATLERAAWLHLDIGPASFPKKSKKYKSGIIYIREDLLINTE